MGRRRKAQVTLRAVSIALAGLVFASTPDRSVADTKKDRAVTDMIGALQTCREELQQEERLACYDALARQNAPPRFSGKLSYKTKPFLLERAHLLRFRSQGVIFVLYLLDEQGNVLQNLHLGGGGEDSHLIEKPGTYSLQIDGSARWQIWLDPA